MIVFGLGNAEPDYSYTRHNVGKDMLNNLASDLNSEFKTNSKLSFQSLKFENSYLVKPLLGMNINGRSLLNFTNYYKLNKEEQSILIIYDELDMQVGNYKFTSGSHSKIHNGIKSLDNYGFDSNTLEYLKIGVRSKNIVSSVKKSGLDPAKYVLQKFPADEHDIINSLYLNELKSLLKSKIS